MTKPKLLVFAQGTATGGGTGFAKLVEAARDGVLFAEITGVVSTYEHGGVRKLADKLGIRFIHFPGPWTAQRYQEIAHLTEAEFFALSGWLKLVVGLDPATRFNSKTVFNIHNGPLPRFGGPGKYGRHVHEAVLAEHRFRGLKHSEVCMHFVTDGIDEGPVFFRSPVRIEEGDTVETLGARVNQREHEFQARITSMVVSGYISWDGVDPKSLRYPSWHSVSRPQ